MADGAGVQLTLRAVVLKTSTAMSRGAAVGTGERTRPQRRVVKAGMLADGGEGGGTTKTLFEMQLHTAASAKKIQY